MLILTLAFAVLGAAVLVCYCAILPATSRDRWRRCGM